MLYPFELRAPLTTHRQFVLTCYQTVTKTLGSLSKTLGHLLRWQRVCDEFLHVLDYVCGAHEATPAKHTCLLVAADLHGDILPWVDQVAFGRPA